MSKEKKELRKHYLQIRNGLSEEKKKSAGISIWNKIFSSDYYKIANVVFVYVSYNNEVDTIEAIEQMLAEGKGVVVPKCDVSEKTMSLYEIQSLTDLRMGAYGIQEPSGEERKVKTEEIDLAVVPGVAFDKKGMRLGYGGGYYDKFLAEFSGMSVGLVYAECFSEELPVEKFDRGVDIVVCSEE